MISCISNPPYNMKWQPPPFAQMQQRFASCEMPPESNANFAFILTALELCEKAAFILPTGVLTTDNVAEKEIRRYLVNKNIVEAVIVCPDKMFEATSIPVCILVFNKKKKNTYTEMIDMRQKYVIEQREQRGQYGGIAHTNRTYKKEIKFFSNEQMEDAIECIRYRKDISGYCKAVTMKDISVQDYILTPSRYVERQAQETLYREYKDILGDLNRIIAEKNSCKLTINETLARTLGFDIELYRTDQTADVELNELLGKIAGDTIKKQNYFTATKNKNELKFENANKDNISSVLLMILQTWKQHIYFLNNEENRYLAELRDALLPKLMSGELKV